MRLRVIAALVAIGLAASACTTSTSGEPTTAPKPTPKSSSSAPVSSAPATKSSSPSTAVPTTGPNVRPGEKPPELTGIGRTNTPSGELAFASYWFESLDWAYATTNSALARSLYDVSCAECSTFLTNIIDYAAQHGHHFRGGHLLVTQTQIIPNAPHYGSTAIVDAKVNQTALSVVATNGHVVGRAKALDGQYFRTWLRWSSGKWKVVDWRLERRK